MQFVILVQFIILAAGFWLNPEREVVILSATAEDGET